MKNILLGINIVLLIAVGVLFYLQFSNGSEETAAAEGAFTASESKIAYIRTDSLMEKSEFVLAGKKKLEEKGEKLNTEYRNRAMGLQREIENYQRGRGNLTISQDRAIAEDLTKKQQNLQLYEQSLTQDLMGEEAKLTQELYDELTAFLKKYSEERGIEVVIKFDPSSDMLYANQAMDITGDVVKGMNELYKAGKSAVDKADSTTAPVQ